MPVIAIDFGGTNIKLGLIAEGGEVLVTSKLKAVADKSIQHGLDSVSEHILELFEQHNISTNSLTGIGIMVPSIVDTTNNKVLSKYVKYTDAHEFDFNAWAKQAWNLPVVVANDAKAALIGEWQYGAGKDCDDLVMITLGTGVGTAVLSEGKLFKGKHYLGGNMGGHISINMHGNPCNCGFFGCLETEASTWALPDLIKQHKNFESSSLSKINNPEFIHLFEEADKGDALAKNMVQHCLKAWGVCAVNMVHAYDPARIIISGGIMKR
ncbi:MAG: ROK family protein, partial [Parafilimonas sp.]